MNNPDFIWAVFEEDISAQTCEVYAQCEPEGFVSKPTKYIREDIAESATRIEQLERERDDLVATGAKIMESLRKQLIESEAKLTNAMDALREIYDDFEGGDEWRIARRALAELEGK